MADSTDGGRGRRTGGWRSRLRVAAHLDLVAVIGITVSIVVSVALDLTNAATGVESFLACLMGITIALLLDANARAERRFRLRGMMEATPWLADTLTPIVAATAEIESRYAGTLVGAEAPARYAALADHLEELRRGRIVRQRRDNEHLLAGTRASKYTVCAVTNAVAGPPGAQFAFWTSDIGRQYWQANLDALQRGVRITRIFIYTRMTSRLRDLIAEQERAGVRVGRLRADGVRAESQLNLALWDDATAWEARLNARGEIVHNIFTLNGQDVARLTAAFQACERAADFGVPVVGR